MKKIVILEWTLKQAVLQVSGGIDPFKYVAIPRVPVNVEIEVPDEEWDRVNRDPLLQGILTEGFKEEILGYCRRTVIPTLHNYDKMWPEIRKVSEFHHKVKMGMRDVIARDLKEIYHACEKVMKYKVADIELQKRQYQHYRWKVAKQAVLNTAAVGTAIAGTAGSVATGGITLPLAVVGLYRSIMSGMKFILDCAAEAEDCQVNVIHGLEHIRRSYGVDAGSVGDLKKAGNTAKELARNLVLNSILKVPCKHTLLTIKDIQGEVDLWGNKLANLRFQAHDLSGQLAEFLDKQDKLKKDLAINEAVAAGLPTSAQSKLEKIDKKHRKALKKAEKEVRQLFEKGFYIPSMAKWLTIGELHLRAEAGSKKINELKPLLHEAEKVGLAKGTLQISTALDIVVSLGLAGASYGLGAIDVTTTADPVLAVISSNTFGDALGVPQDTIATINSLYDFAVSCGANEAQGAWSILLES